MYVIIPIRLFSITICNLLLTYPRNSIVSDLSGDISIPKFCAILCNVNTALAVYEIMWINIEDPYRPQMTIWRMGITCWITKATDTHSEYVILEVFAILSCYAS